jgi:aspartyl-tRNA(Asn)/glutamyl-tRNA(Gln) amidotransferase subunit B
MEQCPVPPDHFSTLVNLIAKGDVTEKMARTILEEMFEKGVSPEAVIETKGLKPIQDSGTLEQMVDDLLAQNPLNFLIGQVMKENRGKADPAALTKLIQKKLRS